MNNSKTIKPKCTLIEWNELVPKLKVAGLNPDDFLECCQVGLLSFHLTKNSIGGEKCKKIQIVPENYL